MVMAERLAQFVCCGIAIVMSSVLFGCGPVRAPTTAPSASALRGVDRAALSKNARIRLTGPTTFFVSPTGSDDANGLTASSPWRTLQHAFDTAKRNYDLAGFPLTIRLADGTYAEE